MVAIKRQSEFARNWSKQMMLCKEIDERLSRLEKKFKINENTSRGSREGK